MDVSAGEQLLDCGHEGVPFFRKIMRHNGPQCARKLDRDGLGGCGYDELENGRFKSVTLRLSDRELVGPWARIINNIRLLDAIFYVDRAGLPRSTGGNSQK